MYLSVPILAAALAGVAALSASRRLHRLRAVWRWLGIGCLLWAAGATASAILTSGSDSTDWPVHIAWIAFLCRAFRSALPLLRGRGREAVLDGLMIAVVATGGAFEFLVLPMTDGAAGAHWPVVFSLTQWALIALAVLSLTGLAWCHRRKDRIAFLTLLGAAAAPAVANVWSAAGHEPGFEPGNTRDVLTWTIGFAWIAAGAWYARRHVTDSFEPANPRVVIRFIRYVSVPAIALLALAIMTVPAAIDGTVNYVFAISRIVLGVLIVLRLHMAANLADKLSMRTQERDRLHAVVDASASIAGATDTEALLRQIGVATAHSLDRSIAEVSYRPRGGEPVYVTVGSLTTWETGGVEQHPLIVTRVPGLPSSPAPFVVTVEDAWLPATVAASWREAGKWEVLLIPMTTGRELLGYLEVWSPFNGSGFPDDAVATAAAIVHEGTLAVQNARLLDETRRQGNERALLLRVSQAASSTLELSNVLSQIAEATLDVEGIERTSIKLWSSETNDLIVGVLRSSAEWPCAEEPGTHHGLEEWPLDRQALAGRDPVHVTVESPGLDDNIKHKLRTHGVGSVVMFPLRVGDELLGLLKFISRDVRAFGAAEIRLGQEMGNQTALAIHHARLLEEERRRAEERAVLLKVSKAATSSLDLSTVLGEIAESTLGIAGIECTSIEIWHPDSDELEIGAERTIPEWPGVVAPGTRNPVNLYAQDRAVLASRNPLCLSVSDSEVDDARRQHMEAAGTGSLLSYPLWAGDQCLGMLSFFARAEHAFGSEAKRVGAEIASTTALAIHNARLLAAERERANDWAVLHRVSRAAIAGLDRRTVLTDIANACLGIEGTECCTIFSIERADGTLVLEADVTIPEWPGVDEPGTTYPLRPDEVDNLVIDKRTPRIVRLADHALSAGDRDSMQIHGIVSMILIPVLISDETTGLIYLSSRSATAFDDNTIRIGSEIAAQAALALQNAQLHETTHLYAQEQAALLRVSRAVSSGKELADVMNEVAVASLAIAGAECCEIEVLHAEQDVTEIVAGQFVRGWSRGETNVGARLSLDDWPVTRRVIETLQPVVLDDSSPRLTPYERRVLFGGDQHSALIVPMVVDDRCVGIVTYYARTKDAFTGDSIRLGLDLASQAAIALERTRLHVALREQANTDGLTGLLNHRAIQERLDEELARAHRDDGVVAVLMVDLNRFKYVNDTHGHQAGDMVLQRASAVLRASVRSYDVVGRYGGDEFMVLLPGTDAVEAVAVAERIVENAAAVRLSGPLAGMSISLSVGLSVFPAQASTRQELIDVADQAMYQAKNRRQRQIVTGPLRLPTAV